MKLRTKILAGYSFGLTLLILVGCWGVWNLWRLGKASDAILQENYQSIRAANGMLDSIERQDSATLIDLLNDDADSIALFQTNEIDFLQWLSRAKDNVTIAGEADILAALEASYRDYLISVAELQQLDESPAATDFYQTTVQPDFSAVRQAVAELRQLNQQTMIQAAEQAGRTSRQAIASMSAAGIGAAALGFMLSLIFSRALTRPLQSMNQAAEQIAEGNYDVALTVRSRDELGQLAASINRMSQRLSEYRSLNVNKIMAQQQRSDAIVNSITDGIVVVDDSALIIAINPTAASLFGTTPTQAMGKHCLEAIDNRSLFEKIQATAESGQFLQPEEDEAIFTVERQTTQHYRYLITPVKTETGQRLGVVVLLQDITQLKEIDQLKSEFVMTASHELRTPLTGMAMSIDLLLESSQGKLAEREQDLLRAAQEDVQRLRNLVNELLDLSKIESGRIEMARVPVDTKLLIEKAIALFQVQVAEKQLQLQAQTGDDLPQVNADPNKITWVLTNLIANALRYAEHKILVAAQPQGTWIRISVEDDGPGIDPAYQGRIFDKFVQVETDRDTGGTGLGLAICKEIVKAHGGTIWVESSPGSGSRFSLTLPIAAANQRSTGDLAHVES